MWTAARALVDEVLADAPSGRRLEVDEVVRLLDAFGLRTPPGQVVDDVEAAVAAARRPARRPVALKALGVDRLGKVEAQGLALDLNDDDEVRAAYERMATHLGDAHAPGARAGTWSRRGPMCSSTSTSTRAGARR